MLRAGDPPPDLVVVIRAAPATAREVIDDLAEDALASGLAYAIEPEPGHREPLFGVSVFARPPGVEVATVLARFDDAPAYLETTVGVLRAAGFVVWPTGAVGNHFDVQLLPGRSESKPTSLEAVRSAAIRLLGIAGELRLNPAYASGGATPLEEP